MSKKEKQLVMNDKETIKSDNFLNNDEIVRMIKSNERIATNNLLIFEMLTQTNDPIDRAVEKFMPMLECINFSRLIAIADFLTRKSDDYVDPKTVFEGEFGEYTFWKDLKCGECRSRNGRIDKKSLADVMIFHLRNLFYEARVRYDLKSKMLFFRDYLSDGSLIVETIENLDSRDMSDFLYELLHDYLSVDDIDLIVKNVMRFITKEITSNNVIQFLDCHVENGIVKEGFYDGSARFTILRNVKAAVDRKRPIKRVKEIDQLLMHLCDYDEATYDRFIALLSTIFLNSRSYKGQIFPSIRIFGQSGANGKSLFADVMKNAFNASNTTSTSISRLNDQHILEKTLQSLVAIDQDSSSSKINAESSANFKAIVTGDILSSRQIYGSSRDIIPMCLLVIFCNNLPVTSDKTDAFNRRLNIIRCSKPLLDTTEFKINDSWFRKVRSDEAAQYLIELLLVESQKYSVKKKDFPERSEAMQMMNDSYRLENDSATMFVQDVGLDAIVGKQVKEVKDHYEKWCEENDQTVLKRQFNESLSEKFDLEAKSVRKDYVSKDSDYYAQMQQGLKSTLRCWQYKDKLKNGEFFRNQL